MNCSETRPWLDAYADGELDLMRSLEVEQHLKGCPACIGNQRSLQSLRTGLRQGDLAFRAPERLRASVLDAVAEASGANKAHVREERSGGHWLWQWLAVGATAFALVTLLLRPAGVAESDRIVQEAVDSHVRSMMGDHLVDVTSSDQHTVKPWFDGKIDFAPTVKDYVAQGFPLIGGRVDYLNGRTVAALVYRHNKHVINVFVWPVTDGKGSAAGVEDRRGYAVINREAGGLHWCLVSDLNGKELGELAGMLGE